MTPLSVALPPNRFSNNLAPSLPRSKPGSPSFCSSILFLIVLLRLYGRIPEVLSDSTIFKILSISSFKIINVLVSKP